MEFLKKTETFFIQLQYCLTIEPEPILEAKKGIYSLMLKPDIFFKLINDFQIEYPFVPENKIIELKSLMNKEGINLNDALKIIENYKNQYWFLDLVIMFEPVTDKLKQTLKSIDSDISEKEINIELLKYRNHLQSKREKIYFDLINEIKSFSPYPIEPIDQEPRKYKSEHYALAYIFDCNAIGESIPIGFKTELEKIGKKRADGTISGNTFYKAVTRILQADKDLNAEKNLVEIAGEDWKAVLLELTKYPEELKKYLQSKQL